MFHFDEKRSDAYRRTSTVTSLMFTNSMELTYHSVKMLQLLILVVSVLLCWGNVECFCDRSVQLGLKCGKSLGTAGILSPLRPVGGEKAIPRLEPGLRFVQARANFLANINKDIKVTKFDLNTLKAFNADGTSLNNPITNLINSASNMASQWSGSLSKYAKKGINVALVLSTLGVLPKRALTRGPSITSRAAFVTATVLAASQFASAKFLSSKPPLTVASPPRTSQSSILNRMNTSLQQVKSMLDFDMNLMKWKNFDSLSATERLATTPVYFVANARGNSYMQNDVKVSLTFFCARFLGSICRIIMHLCLSFTCKSQYFCVYGALHNWSFLLTL